MSDSLWPRESQHARPPCPSPTPGVHSNSCPSSQWCHPAILSSVVPCWTLAWRLLSITLLACDMSAIVWYFEHSLALPFFGIGMKADLFQSCGHCWVFKICWPKAGVIMNPWPWDFAFSPVVKTSVEVMEFQLSCFKSWNMMLWKCCTQYASKFGKLSSGHRTRKGQLSFQFQRKAMPKNAQTTTQLHSSHMLVK